MSRAAGVAFLAPNPGYYTCIQSSNGSSRIVSWWARMVFLDAFYLAASVLDYVAYIMW